MLFGTDEIKIVNLLICLQMLKKFYNHKKIINFKILDLKYCKNQNHKK